MSIHAIDIDDEDDFTESDLEKLPENSPLKDAAIGAVQASRIQKVRRRDFRANKRKPKKSWEALTTGGEFPEQLQEIFAKSIILPRQSFQEKLVLSYLMLPGIKCDMLPVIFSQGKPGCGKSQIGLLSCHLHDTKFVGGSSTAASLRNEADMVRKYNREVSANIPSNEKVCYSLAWNDINPDMLAANDGALLTLLKLSVDRTSVITKASAEEGNKEHWVFGPKYISSISPIYSDPRFTELKRRMLVIQHKPVSMFGADDWDDSNRGKTGSSLVSYRAYDWTGINHALVDYWDNDESIDRWDDLASELDEISDHGIERPLFEMSFDLIVCGVCCGYFPSLRSAIAHWREYWSWHRDNIESQMGASLQAIKRFITEEAGPQMEANKEAIENGMPRLVRPVAIEPAGLKNYLAGCAARGELDSYMDDSKRAEAMRMLGWQLISQGKGTVQWVLSNG